MSSYKNVWLLIANFCIFAQVSSENPENSRSLLKIHLNLQGRKDEKQETAQSKHILVEEKHLRFEEISFLIFPFYVMWNYKFIIHITSPGNILSRRHCCNQEQSFATGYINTRAILCDQRTVREECWFCDCQLIKLTCL